MFDEFPTWTTAASDFALILETQLCGSGVTKPAPIDLGSCGVDPQLRCQPHRCTECDELVVIIDCVFQDFTNSGSGGAIYCGDAQSEFHILRCSFIRCKATGANADGGGIAFAGDNVRVSQCFAEACSAGYWSSFCNLDIPSAKSGTVMLNDSVSLSCSANRGTIRIVFSNQGTAGLPAVVSSINSTGNQATTRGTALGFAQAYLRITQFCHFSSNYPSTILFVLAVSNKDVFECINFFNNTCRDSPDDSKGAIAVNGQLTLRGCLFVGNSIDYLASRFQGANANWAVTLTHCLFDHADFAWSFTITFKTELCYVTAGSDAIDHFTCPATAGFEASLNPSKSAAFPISAEIKVTGEIGPSPQPLPSALSRSPALLATNAARASGKVLNSGAINASRRHGDSELWPESGDFHATELHNGSYVFLDSRGRDASADFGYSLVRHSLAFGGSAAAFERTGAFQASGGNLGFAPSHRFTPSPRFIGNDRAEDDSSAVWMGLGIGLGVFALAAGALVLFFVIRRRRTSEDPMPADCDVDGPTSWNESIQENEEFIEAVNPLDASGHGDSMDDGFDGGPAAE
jgi:hypothetical protein